MTNEEKAKEIIKVSDTKQVYDIVDFSSLEVALREDLMQMAQWKDEQFEAKKQALIDKACEWLEQHLYDDEYITRDNEGTWVDAYFLSKGLKQAMKEE